jgi:hypothetical protein
VPGRKRVSQRERDDKGRERGITADLVCDFEQYINRKYAKELGERPITIYMIPTTRDELLQDVAEGLGDIAVGNITVTGARRTGSSARRIARCSRSPRTMPGRAASPRCATT